MPTLVGPWLGGSSKARIEIDYTVTYNTDRTNAFFSGMVYLATQFSITDSFNSWSVSGHLGSASGSNVHMSHGSGGGRTAIKSIAGWRQGNATINASVSGLEAIGVTVDASIALPSGPLAPYIITARPTNIGQSSFTAEISNATGNGGTLNRAQVKTNTVQSDSGAVYFTRESFGNIAVSGLLPGTRYYIQMRVHNNTWGWGPWTGWMTVDTLPGLYVKVDGVWRNAIPYVKASGVWKQATRHVKVAGVWK